MYNKLRINPILAAAPLRHRLLAMLLALCLAFLGAGASAKTGMASEELVALANSQGVLRDAPFSPDQLRLIADGLMSLQAAEQDVLLAHLEQRIGLEVDPHGYMLFYDEVRLARGEPMRFGSIPEIVEGRVIIPDDATQYTPRRLNVRGETIELFYAKIQRSIDAGTPPLESYKFPISAKHPIAPEKPALRIELLSLAARDQQARLDGDWQLVSQVESATTSFIKALVERDGIPTEQEVGPAGVSAAWLLIQHAVSDPDFMASCLDQLEIRWQQGSFSSIHYALLADKVRVLRGEYQIYGTQTGGDEEGTFFYKVEEPSKLNARRRNVGLPPFPELRLATIRWVAPDAPSMQIDQAAAQPN